MIFITIQRQTGRHIISIIYINYESISTGVKGPLCGAEILLTSVYTYATTIFLFRLSHLLNTQIYTDSILHVVVSVDHVKPEVAI